MKKYVYPAIFTPEDGGLYSVDFPDLEGCYTCGDDLADAIYMAEDVLAFTLYDLEKSNASIPEPSKTLEAPEGSFVNYVACDTLEYQRRNNNKAVKKTLSIPEWLNEIAVSSNINFSQVLQEALMDRLNIAK
ncbi:MAG: type II toxin-antitoxin system HicB family antitoxin [Lachnospiraceae bacterium]|nr:type II toxin-antitoxin system HicB family antitoxin [Lachnospiraceae bacterium]